jgi:hypothetical protein
MAKAVAKGKAKAKPRAKKVVVDKYAQLPRSLQPAAKALDERDLTARIQNALNARRHRDERAEDIPEHRGPVDIRHLGRVVDRVAGQLRSPSMSVTPSARLHAAFAAMRGRPPSDDEF